MKHYKLMLGLVIALGFITSCKKNDYPPHGEVWQLSKVLRSSLEYRYDNQHRLTNITRVPWGFGPNFQITTDQLGRPLTLKDSISPSTPDQFLYQYGKLTGISGSQTTPTTFTYDPKGRIIRKDGNANYYSYVIYEYEGNSRNFKRASFFSNSTTARATEEPKADVIIEYTRDNKINPYSTISNSKVIPFWFAEYMGPTFYDPVVPNNSVKEEYFGRVDTGYFKFMEHQYTYVYENDYPTTFTFQYISYNYPDGTPGFSSTQSGGYTYNKFHW